MNYLKLKFVIIIFQQELIGTKKTYEKKVCLDFCLSRISLHICLTVLFMRCFFRSFVYSPEPGSKLRINRIASSGPSAFVRTSYPSLWICAIILRSITLPALIIVPQPVRQILPQVPHHGPPLPRFSLSIFTNMRSVDRIDTWPTPIENTRKF